MENGVEYGDDRPRALSDAVLRVHVAGDVRADRLALRLRVELRVEPSREVAGLMRHFIPDYEAVAEQRRRALPYMLDAHRRVWDTDIGFDRFIPRAR